MNNVFFIYFVGGNPRNSGTFVTLQANSEFIIAVFLNINTNLLHLCGATSSFFPFFNPGILFSSQEKWNVRITHLQVEVMQAHVHCRFFLNGGRVAHVQVTLLILQLGDFMLQRTQVSPYAFILRLKALGLLLLPHCLLDLRLQGDAACTHPARLTPSLLELLLHPCDCSDQILRQLRVLNQACEESVASHAIGKIN